MLRFMVLQYGPFRNCQLWSFITVHGQFLSNRLRICCQVTIWPRKHKRKTPSQAFTRSKQIYRIGRSLKFCGTVLLYCCMCVFHSQFLILNTHAWVTESDRMSRSESNAPRKKSAESELPRMLPRSQKTRTMMSWAHRVIGRAGSARRRSSLMER